MSISTVLEDRALVVVRAPAIPDPVALAEALAAGGLHAVELTFTTPDVLSCLEKAAASGAVVGAGTVVTAEQAASAIDSGATFLVTPGLRPDVARVATERNVPVVMGALTPSEIMVAVDLGAAAVKVFPAKLFGPSYFADLRGPFPDTALIPSGGVNADNAADFLARGAVAVTAGTDVVPPDAIVAGRWDDITSRAAHFVRAIARP
ncbi:bifunctional 4-hydroxy-2-oxoglutarate aldolase/2-dehydro-3-deoxy-phosphogluconate aldolase [Rhodococcoides kroppenstedtii]|uniref:bifunctional 4-hydroxy-2-oxoglutarate aldolase/2-dehydro-3-deoxy-phosphogluconate aldolase n=1 Tax=Rhodococcoides kroppenstedtii TaxID=293050 RepID=UPI0028E7C5F3|nr:bifunctional 4-hydroxy-2-oxoglutarate aldolase/2-dehydro-3-deoxy-phosphogluconate aldolase [Rhodococcus kroppenstedtii]